MQDINNIINPNTSLPPKLNIFKYLAFISISVLLIVLAYFYVVLKNINTKLLLIQSNNNISQTVPTAVPTKTIGQIDSTETPKTNVSYQVESIDDSQNQNVKLILKSNTGNQVIIDEAKYWQLPGGQIVKPMFTNIEISSTNNYISYFISSGYEGGSSFLYNIKNKEKVNLKMSSETYGYDKNEQYFFSCSGPGIDEGGAKIYKLSTMSLIYKAPGTCYKCQLNSNNNIEIIEHESCVPNQPKKIEFLTKTGTIKQ